MTALAPIFGYKIRSETPEASVPWVLPKQNIGIEIEAEMNLRDVTLPRDLSLWDMKSDGSLISGREYVLTRPLCGDTLAGAVYEIFQEPTKFKRAVTSGTHIHLDMTDAQATVGVLQAMTMLVGIIEPAIYAMFGDNREWCGYTNQSDLLPREAVRCFLGDDFQSNPSSFINMMKGKKTYKYYGFNLHPLTRYGSVEFRYFPTSERAEELIEWIQFVMSIKKATIALNDLSGVKSMMAMEYSYEEFIRENFQPWASRMLEVVPYIKARGRRRKMLTLVRSKPATTGATQTHKQFMALIDNDKYKKYFSKKVKKESGGYEYQKYELGTFAHNVWDFNETSSASQSLFTGGDIGFSTYTMFRFSEEGHGWETMVEWPDYMLPEFGPRMQQYDFPALLSAVEDKFEEHPTRHWDNHRRQLRAFLTLRGLI